MSIRVVMVFSDRRKERPGLRPGVRSKTKGEKLETRRRERQGERLVWEGEVRCIMLE